jgi:lactate 2-monooxygenase
MSASNYGDYQIGIYMQGMIGMKPSLPLNLEELERQAREKIDPRAYWYVAGGAGAEDTVKTNRDAFAKWQIVPRMLRNVKQRNHATTLFGKTMPAPVMLAPVGVQEIVHPEAERAVARAAKSLDVPMILSTLSSTKLEDVAEIMGDASRWFQLYWPGDPEVTKSLIRRAEAAGYGAIVVTLDTRLMGWREHDLQEAYLPFLEGKGIANYVSDPAFRAALEETPEENPRGAIAHWATVYADPSQTWDDLKLIRDTTKLPVLLKGILHPEDAQLALKHGMDGIVVSNHGGRQLGGSISGLDALPAIADAVGGKCPVLLDSGVRYGSDVVKALALGADAVLLGRPFIWGLAVAGEEGVREVVRRFLADYDLAMALAGFNSPSELSCDVLVRA